MPRIILKCRYLKHEKAHLAHLVRYIATREGVEMARDTHDHLPATARQKQLIDELLRALPDTQESYEYRDYQANPVPVCRSYCHEYRKKSPDMKGTYGPSYFPYGERMQCD